MNCDEGSTDSCFSEQKDGRQVAAKVVVQAEKMVQLWDNLLVGLMVMRLAEYSVGKTVCQLFAAASMIDLLADEMAFLQAVQNVVEKIERWVSSLSVQTIVLFVVLQADLLVYEMAVKQDVLQVDQKVVWKVENLVVDNDC